MKEQILIAANRLKPKKELCFNSVVNLMNNCKDESSIADLAQLYSYFIPKRPTGKKLTGFEWVSLAKGKKDARFYLNEVRVQHGAVVATNGHMLHAYHYDCGLEENKSYDQGKNIVPGSELWRYPDYRRVVSEPHIDNLIENFNPNELRRGYFTNKKGGDFVIVNDLGFDLKYFNEVIRLDEEYEVYLFQDKIQFHSKQHTAVIMTVRLNDEKGKDWNLY